MKYPILILGAAVALLAADPTPAPSASPTASPTAPFSPSPLFSPGAYGAPSPSSSPNAAPEGTEPPALFGPRHGTPAHPKATPSPIPDERKGLDGVWEVQIQRGNDTQYEHFNLKQTGTSLAGTYLTFDKKKYPIAGTLDGSNVRLVVSLADGTTILLEAKVDGTTDMLGMFTNSKERIPFTAAYRPKEKWIDNLNAQPGGIGGQGGYQPPH